jgi:hypothetical protein
VYKTTREREREVKRELATARRAARALRPRDGADHITEVEGQTEPYDGYHIPVVTLRRSNGLAGIAFLLNMREQP